jgi:hypothetical protein
VLCARAAEARLSGWRLRALGSARREILLANGTSVIEGTGLKIMSFRKDVGRAYDIRLQESSLFLLEEA